MTTCIFPNSPNVSNLFHPHVMNNINTSNAVISKQLTVSAQKNKNFQIFIKTLTGQSITIEICSKDKVIDLKYKIWKKINIPVDSQRLIFQMSQLQDEKAIEYYNIQKESTIHLALRLVAGVQVKVQTKGGVYALGDSNTLADATNSYKFYEQPQTQPNQMYNLTESKKRGSYTKKACANCRKSHSACDAGRPCKRCLQLGLTDCMDAERKSKKRDFEEMNNFKPYTNMMDFLPLLGQLPQKIEEDKTVKKEEICFEEEKPLEFQELFNDVLDTNDISYESEDSKKRKIDIFEDFEDLETQNEEFQFPNDFSFSLENNDLTVGPLGDFKTENFDLFPEESKEEEEEELTTTQKEEEDSGIELSPSDFEKSIVPYEQYDHNSRNGLIIPREDVQELTNGDPQQDLLIKSLMVAHLKQEQELRELRELVSNLQNLLIVQASMQSSSKQHLNVNQ
eukprot:gene1151-10665_t